MLRRTSSIDGVRALHDQVDHAQEGEVMMYDKPVIWYNHRRYRVVSQLHTLHPGIDLVALVPYGKHLTQEAIVVELEVTW